MESFGDSHSCGDVGSAVRMLTGEAALSVTEADAPRTSDALAFAVHVFTGPDAPAARVFPRRAVLATRPAATGRCATDFRYAGRIEDELEAAACASALSGLGGAMPTGSARVETFVTVARSPMQKKRRLGRKSVFQYWLAEGRAIT